MLYNISINQKAIVEHNYHNKTDLVDWAIISYLASWYFTQNKKTIFVQDDAINYIWLNYNHLINSMPLLGIKSKTAISERISKLKKLKLIKTFKTQDNNLYFILTPLCMEIAYLSNKDKDLSETNTEDIDNEDKTGSEKQLSNLDEQAIQVGRTPLYKLDEQHNNNINNNNIYNNNSNKLLEKEQSIEVLFSNNLLVSGENSLTKTKSNSVYSVYLSYIKHWKIRYNTLKEPALTKKLSGQIKLLLRDFKDMREIDKMLEAFISCDEGYLISKMHDFGLFLCDLNKWRALSNNPQLAKIFTIEYAKNRMYLQKKEMVQKEEEKRREQENIERIRQEKIQLEIYKQEQERKKKEEQELLKKQKEELERQRKEEEKRLAESFRKHLEANYVERKA